MDIKQLETQIKGLKSKMGAQKENTDAVAVRALKKALKRTQRRKNRLVKKTAFIAAKAKKKEQSGS